MPLWGVKQDWGWSTFTEHSLHSTPSIPPAFPPSRSPCLPGRPVPPNPIAQCSATRHNTRA
ncbi:hypothetical protein E2C01_003142 [Portunus trituberculatus]|uniref:Uncharacterized protein n=1 Tax=Portunus trituberculatus TaxID=210409 RepID=A0A5B7CQ91_PORTR|nr:hypothetical protein [Portunus trituberculatus]